MTIGFDLYVCFIIIIFSSVSILLQICKNNSKDYLYIVLIVFDSIK